MPEIYELLVQAPDGSGGVFTRRFNRIARLHETDYYVLHSQQTSVVLEDRGSAIATKTNEKVQNEESANFTLKFGQRAVLARTDTAGNIVNPIAVGKIERLEPTYSLHGPALEVFFRSYIHELDEVLIDEGPTAALPVGDSVDFSDGLIHSTYSGTGADVLASPYNVIVYLVNMFRIGGTFNAGTIPYGSPNIWTDLIDYNLVGAGTAIHRNYRGSGFSVLEVITRLSELVQFDGVTEVGADFWLDNNRQFVMFPRMNEPTNAKVFGLTLVYGQAIGDGTSSVGVYRMPILFDSFHSDSADDIKNNVIVVGGADTTGANVTGSSDDQTSIDEIGRKSVYVQDLTMVNSSDATLLASVLRQRAAHVFNRAMIGTVSRPRYRLNSDAPFTYVRAGEMVRIIDQLKDVDADYQVQQLDFDYPENIARLELVRPGSGLPFGWQIERQLRNISRQIKMTAFSALGPGVGIAASSSAAPATPGAPDTVPPAPEAAPPGGFSLLRPISSEFPLGQLFGADVPGYGTLGYDNGHSGVDIPTAMQDGYAIYAADAGTIEIATFDATAGNYVQILHSYGRTRYLHMKLLCVAVGQTVARGQKLGNSGNTGTSTGPHLHFDFIPNIVPADARRTTSSVNGFTFIDPEPYLTTTGQTYDLTRDVPC